MSSRILLNLALFGLAGILLAVIIYRPGVAPEPLPQTVTTLTGEGISRIQVTRMTRDPLLFTRAADSWMLTGSHEIPASGMQMRLLLALLEARALRSYPADSLDLEAVGLAPPQATLILGDNRFEIGLTDPLDGLRYIKTGDTVVLVPDQYQHLINAGWPSFAERRLLPADAQVTRLQLPTLTLSLSADNQWQMDPAVPAIRSSALQTLVSNWEQATAYYVRAYQGNTAADTGTDTIRIDQSNTAEALTFHILARTPELILARPEQGIQYHLKRETGDSLLDIITEEPHENQPDIPPDTVTNSTH